MIFDTHSHCYFEKLAIRTDEIHGNMMAANVTHSTQIGCDIPSSRAAIALARKYPNWYATVGYHPVDAQNPGLSQDRAGDTAIPGTEMPNNEPGESDTERYRESREAGLRNLIRENRDIVVAVGETGLDRHYLSKDPTRREKEISEQRFWFGRLAQFGKDYSLPLVIHSREARQETIDAIKEFEIRNAVIHCFSEDYEFAREIMEYSDGMYFSFSGILTYPSAPEIRDAAAKLPLDRILVETDAPFLSPQAVRGKTNEPSHTKFVLECLCRLRKESAEEVERTVFENSLRFYGLKS